MTASKNNRNIPETILSFRIFSRLFQFYRVFHQLVLTFHFNSWLFGYSYQKKSNLQFQPKWFNLNFATLIFTKFPKSINFFTFRKKLPKKKRFCAGPPPPPELHIGIVKKKSEFHVWIWRKKKISCTWVHGLEKKTKYHVTCTWIWR